MIDSDIERILMSAEDISKGVDKVAKEINEDYANLKSEKPVLVIGMLTGAYVFTADLTRKLNFPCSIDFMSASSYGASTESSGSIVIKKDVSEVEGRHVLLVEDIIDSGLSMKYILALLKKRRIESIKLCSLLSKPSRRQSPVKIDYLGFEIPDEFVVGYGLDYAGQYRTLPYIGVLKREVYK